MLFLFLLFWCIVSLPFLISFVQCDAIECSAFVIYSSTKHFKTLRDTKPRLSGFRSKWSRISVTVVAHLETVSIQTQMPLQRLQHQPLVFGVEDKFCSRLLPSYVIMCMMMCLYSLPNCGKLSPGTEVQLIVALCRRTCAQKHCTDT